jgi:rfaE bifunctional protein kinase chain/domain
MQRLASIIHAFKNTGIIVVGDIMIDRYCRGKINRISPEAPVPVVDISETENRPGGAANVALNIRSLEAVPYLFSVTGMDNEARQLLQLLQQNHIDTTGIVQVEYKKTTVKTRIIAGNQQVVRLDDEDSFEITKDTVNSLLEKITTCIANHTIKAIILQDYNKGVLTPELIDAIIEVAQMHDIPVTVDPKKDHFFNYSYVTLFKPNLKEIRDAMGFHVSTDLKSLTEAADQLRLKLRHQHTMITLSDKGIFISNQHYNEIIPTRTHDIADVSGAGDTVISIAALGLATGVDLKDIAFIANIAGGLVCGKPGVVPVVKRELLESLS